MIFIPVDATWSRDQHSVLVNEALTGYGGLHPRRRKLCLLSTELCFVHFN